MGHSGHSINECLSAHGADFWDVYRCLWPGDAHANGQLRNNELLLVSQRPGGGFGQIFSQRFSMATKRCEICHPGFLAQMCWVNRLKDRKVENKRKKPTCLSGRQPNRGVPSSIFPAPRGRESTCDSTTGSQGVLPAPR